MAKTRLEKIADDLISGKITSQEAKNLSAGLVLSKGKSYSDNERGIFEEGNVINLLDEAENPLGYISFRFDIDDNGTKYAWIELANSYDSGKGNFSKLFNYFFEMAKRKNAAYIALEVDEGNTRARDVYDHFDFYSLGYNSGCSAGHDMILMRKDIL